MSLKTMKYIVDWKHQKKKLLSEKPDLVSCGTTVHFEEVNSIAQILIRKAPCFKFIFWSASEKQNKTKPNPGIKPFFGWNINSLIDFNVWSFKC